MILTIHAGAVHLSRRRRLFEWVRLFAGYSAVQASAQAFGFLAGIVVVHKLSKEDYACFMIVNTLGPVMNLLSDSGIISSLSAIGGSFWQDDEQLGSLVNTALALRRWLVFFTFLAVTPMLVWMLWRNHVQPPTIALLIPITLAGVFCQLNVGVFSVVLNLRQQVGRMQALVFSGVLPRLVLIASFAAWGVLNAPLAVAAGSVAIASQYWLVKQWVRPEISNRAPPSKLFRTRILSIVKRQAPLTIYFCVQGQIGLWLISIFGNVNRVAEVGALGRIGMIFTILASTTAALVVPRFARSQELSRLRTYYSLIPLGFAGVISCITVLAWLFPYPLLWVLGAQYAQLRDLVWLAVLGAGSSALGNVIYSLNVNKGWVPPAAFVVPIDIANQVILCSIFDLSSVGGILWIGTLAPLIPAIVNFIIGLRKLKSMSRTSTSMMNAR